MLMKRSQPRKVPFVEPVINYETDIVEYDIVQKVVKTGEGDEDYIIKDKEIEVSRINRQEFLNSQAKDHSVYGIIDKVIKTGDATLLHKGDEGVYGDGTLLLADRADIVNASARAKEDIIKNIPADLIGDLSIDEFVKGITEEAIKKYYAAKNKTEEKEVVNNG